MSMDIITDIDELSGRCDEIDIRKENEEMRTIILALKNVVREKNLTSLSAPQLGFSRRIFVINFNGDIRTFINPIITEANGFEMSRESCPSIPGKEYIRPRSNTITVLYQTPLGKAESRKLFGAAAIVFQHELDHLDGLLLSDIGLEVPEGFDDAPESEREALIKEYLDSIDAKSKEARAEVEKDEILKKTNDAIEFMEKIQKGEVKMGETESVTVKSAEKEPENTQENVVEEKPKKKRGRPKKKVEVTE